jgi:hypothetical protein
VNSMTAFRRRPGLVEAIQWTGDNRAAMREFTDGGGTATTSTSIYAGGVWVRLGGWLVRDEGGRYAAFDARAFAETFEPADDTETPHA